jgi:hypothetical protein
MILFPTARELLLTIELCGRGEGEQSIPITLDANFSRLEAGSFVQVNQMTLSA